MKKENNKKFYIKTIGCQMNKSDSERLSAFLEGNGYKETSKRNEADLIFINTCGVRQSAEDRIYGLIPGIKRENPNAKIILTGCLVNRTDVRRRIEGSVDLWFPIVDLFNLDKELNKIWDINFNKNDDNFSCRDDYLKVSPKIDSSFSALIPIGNGCNNFCSYCVVPYARGREKYRPVKEIIKEIRDLVKIGYKEITLIAQNVNSYSSSSTDFSDLLKKVNDIEGNFWIRFITSHPKDMSDKLINTIATCEKICSHIHLPAQSGDNKILEAMNRKYTIEHYKKLILKIRKKCSLKKFILQEDLLPVSISTDLIVGFPGETKKQFENSKKLFKEAKYDLAYTAQYSPRYGTTAYKLEDNVGKKEKERRENELLNILKKTAETNNEKYLGKRVLVLVEGKNKKGFYNGKTCTYKNVNIIENNKKIEKGEFIMVKIIKTMDFGLEGVLI
ncbi:tRNA (N6-isopentenyl adenosine(37)-C2)-methylthiotransferase MiaB [bacterium]|nr:tRNA (N6-isopentenyl adenosine(37)-C2)-methylthiotransferase MiaB [bacterium]